MILMYSLLFTVGYKSYLERKQNSVWKYLNIETFFFWLLSLFGFFGGYFCVVFPIQFITKDVDLNTT